MRSSADAALYPPATSSDKVGRFPAETNPADPNGCAELEPDTREIRDGEGGADPAEGLGTSTTEALETGGVAATMAALPLASNDRRSEIDGSSLSSRAW